MIRRLYKARNARNWVTNRTYQVWWTVWHTTINNHRRMLLLGEQQILALALKSSDRSNFSRGWTRISYKPNIILVNQYGFQQYRKKYIFSKKYKIKTQWQTKTGFVNTLNSAGFSILFLIQHYKIIKWSKIQLITPLLNNNATYLKNSSLLYQKYTYLNTIPTKFWQERKQLNLFNLFGTSGFYSWRELTARVLQNKHWRYVFHMYFSVKLLSTKL